LVYFAKRSGLLNHYNRRMPSQRCLILVFLAALAAQCQANPSRYESALRSAAAKHYEEALSALTDVVDSQPSFARAYGKILSLSKSLGKPELARSLFERLASGKSSPYANYALALWYRDQQQPAEAERFAKTSVEQLPDFLPAYKELVDTAAQADHLDSVSAFLTARTGSAPAGALYGLACVARVQKNWKKALEYLSRAETAAPGAWEISIAQYTAYYKSDRHREALAVLRRMREQAVRTRDREYEAQARGYMGFIHSDLGEYAEAIDHFEFAIQWAAETGDGRAEESSRGQLGLVYIYLAQYPRAEQEVRTAIRICQELGLRMDHERNLALLGRIHEETGDYPKALDVYEESVRIAQAIGDRTGEADHLARISHVHAATGNYLKGLQSSARGLEIAQQVRNPWVEGSLLEIHGRLQWRLGRSRDALQTLQRGVQVARSIGDRLGLATRLARVGEVLAGTGQMQKALPPFEEALRIAAHTQARILEGELHNDLGSLYLARADFQRSEEHFRLALAAGEDTSMTEVLWRAKAGMGALLEKKGALPEAAAEYAGAIRTIEQVRGRLPMTETRADFLEDKIAIYKKLIRLLAPTNPAEAFHYSERARSRAFLDTLAESNAGPGAGIDSVFAEKLRAVERRLSAAQAGIIAQYTGGTPNQSAVRWLKQEFAAAGEEHFQVRRELRKANPLYAALHYPEPLKVGEAQKLAGSALLLGYSLDREQSYVFALSGTEYRTARLPGAPLIERRVRKLREAVSTGPARTSFASSLVEAQALYRELIAPVSALLRGKREVIIIPDGALYYLPFELLLQNGAEHSSRPFAYLGTQYAIRYIPSASILAALRDRPHTSGKKMLLAYGDPDYGGIGAGPDPFRGELLEHLGEGFTRLPDSRREVENIGRLYRDAGAVVVTGDQSTEEHVKHASLAEFRILHFALHGITDEYQPQFSGLVLNRPRPGAAEDGLLQAYEIAQLNLNAELVVLSACETATGKQMKGEGLVGLTQAFLAAGASSVIASLWQVQDTATTEFMIRFHRHLRRGNYTTAEALRRTRVDLIAGGTYAHPYYWAPFVIFGETSALK
jgi:CHAT domain-containing protein/lipopolysaccharide biosynthesis regulator YciM